METIKPGQILKHFKRELCSQEEKNANYFLYYVVDIAINTETNEPMLVYKALYAPFTTWVRPLSMVFEKVDKEKFPTVKQECRFEVWEGKDA